MGGFSISQVINQFGGGVSSDPAHRFSSSNLWKIPMQRFGDLPWIAALGLGVVLTVLWSAALFYAVYQAI
jgi:hypothetical protein